MLISFSSFVFTLCNHNFINKVATNICFLQIYHSTTNVTRCIEKREKKAEILICGYFHKCDLKFCMQSHPLKPILSSMSCSMQNVFRHHIFWVSHMSIKHEKGSPFVFTLPLLLISLWPLFCFWLKNSKLQLHLSYAWHCSGIYRQAYSTQQALL